MSTVYTEEIVFKEYIGVFRLHDIEPIEIGPWLVVGDIDYDRNWIFYLTMNVVQVNEILEKIIPVLKEFGVSYQMVKDELIHFNKNHGVFGYEEIGKTLIVGTKSEKEAMLLADRINSLTSNNSGPIVGTAVRIGKCLFAVYSFREPYLQDGKWLDSIVLEVPPKARIPFKIYPTKASRRFLRGLWLRKILRDTPKGQIYLAISIFEFTKCLVKVGNSSSLDDRNGRDITDRLSWQGIMLRRLEGVVNSPRFFSFFLDGDRPVLVMEYVSGTRLSKYVKSFYKGRVWGALIDAEKIQLLIVFSKVISIVQKIHKHNIVHRDITDGNFIVLKSGDICVIDFELSFDFNLQFPSPPFVMGTPGYMAPEVLRYSFPTFSEDIYSLGCLLMFMVFGCLPSEFMEESMSVTIEKLHSIGVHKDLVQLIEKCTSIDANGRPTIEFLEAEVNRHTLKIRNGSDE